MFVLFFYIFGLDLSVTNNLIQIKKKNVGHFSKSYKFNRNLARLQNRKSRQRNWLFPFGFWASTVVKKQTSVIELTTSSKIEK